MKLNPDFGKIRKWLTMNLPLVLFVAALAASLWGTYYTHLIAEAENQGRFNDLKSRIAEAIEVRFKFHENALNQTKALFMQGQEITNQDFKIYVYNIGLVDRFPGMTAIGYAEYVSQSELASFIEQMKKQGLKNYNVWPQEKGRVFYTPVKFIEPFIDIVRDMQGFDLVSDPERREAMIRSAASGEATVTEEIETFLKNAENNETGFDIFIPVYTPGIDPPTREEKIQKTLGYVFGVFSAKYLFNLILKENDMFEKKASIEVFLQKDDRLSKVYNSDALFMEEDHVSKFSETFVVTMANRNWPVKIKSLSAFENTLSNSTRWYVLAFGLALSFSFLFFTKHLQKSMKATEESEKKYKQVAESNSLLLEVGKNLGTSLEASIILKRLADFFASNFCHCCVIHVQDSEHSNALNLLTHSYNVERAEACERTINDFSGGHHLLQYVFKERKPLYQKTSALGEKSFLSLPLFVRNEPYAIISLLYNEVRELTTEENNLITQAIKVAETHIENSLLYKEAQIASRLKDEFLATVSHELRTPLMVILGYSRLLLKKVWPPDIQKQILSINKAADNQSSLIEDLLDVSAIISGKVKFKPKTVEMKEVVIEATENLKIAAQNKNIEMKVGQLPSSIIMGDKDRLAQIIINLLTNAIKFTPSGGKIDVNMQNINSKCEIRIKDSGKGIEPEFLPHVFEKFRQEEKTSTRKKGGLGLGLSIVSSLVELHGGKVKVESQGKDKGSTFTLSFPLIDAQKTVMLVEGPQDDRISDSLHHKNVLVLDDEPDALDLISRILEGYEAKVFTARNVVEALKILEELNIDLVVSDLAMPELDGFDFIHQLREKELTTKKHLPVIALTAFAQEQDKKKVLESGFDLYLKKPFEPDYLVKEIKQILH